MRTGKQKPSQRQHQRGKTIVDRSATETPDLKAGEELKIQPVFPSDLSQYMAAIGRKGGRVGGKRRMKTMTKAARRKIAAKAAKARWAKHKAAD